MAATIGGFSIRTIVLCTFVAFARESALELLLTVARRAASSSAVRIATADEALTRTDDTANISGVLGMKRFVHDYGNAVPTGTVGGNVR